MEEIVLNNRRLKLIDGEIWVWKPIKNPYWFKLTYSINEGGYYFITLRIYKVKESISQKLYWPNRAEDTLK